MGQRNVINVLYGQRSGYLDRPIVFHVGQGACFYTGQHRRIVHWCDIDINSLLDRQRILIISCVPHVIHNDRHAAAYIVIGGRGIHHAVQRVVDGTQRTRDDHGVRAIASDANACNVTQRQRAGCRQGNLNIFATGVHVRDGDRVLVGNTERQVRIFRGGLFSR